MINLMIDETSLPLRRRGFCVSVVPMVLLSACLLFACGDDESSTHSEPHEASQPEGMSSEEWGAWLFSSYGCAACHSVAGAPGIGPALNEIAGTERTLIDGTTALADTSYLRAAILEPSEHIPMGYEATMPLYELSYPQVDALVAYLNHLGGVVPEEEK